MSATPGFADGTQEETITSILALGLSHDPTEADCVTQWLKVPAVAVETGGGVAEPVPPVAAVYHNKLVPVTDDASETGVSPTV
jgi:predicted lysophospholipase L1 biosynthesis ABC-type transport system permease subunit